MKKITFIIAMIFSVIVITAMGCGTSKGGTPGQYNRHHR